ncbi:MAG: FRG domain-containing protein [Chitinophagales bacterium]|nr:FRG domain-containing protein [Chitinophagales bacterium]
MQLYTANSLAEYSATIANISKLESLVWYRGHSNSMYRLEPTLYRKKVPIPKLTESEKLRDFRLTKGKFILPNDIGALDAFKEYYSKVTDCSNYTEIDYLYIMQHYGILTRLLDFSADPYVALYFALANHGLTIETPMSSGNEIADFLENDGWSEKGASVYCLNPMKLNMGINGNEEIIDLSKYEFNSLSNADFPFAIKTDNSNPRILAQKGTFIYFGFWVKSLEEYFPIEKSLTKIFIPNSCKKEIYHQLRLELGITHFTIFPDTEGISKEINEKMMGLFDSQVQELFDTHPRSSNT